MEITFNYIHLRQVTRDWRLRGEKQGSDSTAWEPKSNDTFARIYVQETSVDKTNSKHDRETLGEFKLLSEFVLFTIKMINWWEKLRRRDEKGNENIKQLEMTN